MNELYVLLCNSFPVAISSDMNTLEERRREQIALVKEDEHLQVIHEEESSITYHTGISYITDDYTIYKVPVI